MANEIDAKTEQRLLDRAQEKLARRKRFEEVFPSLVDEVLDYCRGEGSECSFELSCRAATSP